MMPSNPNDVLLPSHSPLNAKLKIQNRRNVHSSWEFTIDSKKELSRYSTYPTTAGDRPEGILITLRSDPHECPAAFHGYGADRPSGQHIHIGSARGLLGPEASKEYDTFLLKAFGLEVGTDVEPIDVHLQPIQGNVVIVSRR